MARKAFNLDVSTASEKKIPGIVTVAKGDDDGDVTVTYAPASGPPIEIGMLALGKSSIPLSRLRYVGKDPREGYKITTSSYPVPEAAISPHFRVRVSL